MTAWLGNGLWWASILIAGAWVWFNLDLSQWYPTIVFGGAVFILLVGLAARHVLAGEKEN